MFLQQCSKQANKHTNNIGLVTGMGSSEITTIVSELPMDKQRGQTLWPATEI